MKNIAEMKDEKLDSIIKLGLGNIAQFVSYAPTREDEARFININEYNKHEYLSDRELILKLIDSAPSKAINIRSYSVKTMKGNKLIYNKNVNDIDEILMIIEDNRKKDNYSIINENIDINDGGVSGVVLGNIIEFSPEDTPKCVDKQGVCLLPKDIGMYILEKVYGFMPEIDFKSDYRVEFSIHPKRQGVKKEHTIIWEYEKYQDINYEGRISWPNNFSQFIGDKVFGLLVADSLGIKVPKTTVVSRNVAPFMFGKETGLLEKWIRTSPIKKEPGKYKTSDTWIDIFEFMNIEEEKGNDKMNIASILSQDAVDAQYSGASFIFSNYENDIIEGVAGKGDLFMIGEEGSCKLPEDVINEVKRINNKIRSHYNYLGDVSIEWVYDGTSVWVLQMNKLKNNSTRDMIVEGNPSKYVEFDVKRGLDELRELILKVKDNNIGIELIGNVGITSHFGDLLRLSNIPSKLINIKDRE